MFYYYGRKKRLVKLYPEPIGDIIIEPFAGSAAYAMNYSDKKVIIIDKDPVIIGIWRYLQRASREDILGLPLIPIGDSLKDEKYSYLSFDEKNLIGFYIQMGHHPSSKPTKFGRWNEKNRDILANNVLKIKHWEIIEGDYTDAKEYFEYDNVTWFIDPPYQGRGGSSYRCNNKQIDYQLLKEWILKLKGRVIVCENSEADWMKFRFLKNINGANKRSTEMVWVNDNF